MNILLILALCQLADDTPFTPCNLGAITEYYRADTHYQGGLRAIRRFFREHFQPLAGVPGQDGYVRIRFVVNCKGETGYFDVLEMDRDYRAVQFDPALSQQLLGLTRELDGWVPGEWHGKVCDSFMFLTFKLKDGDIQDILPR